MNFLEVISLCNYYDNYYEIYYSKKFELILTRNPDISPLVLINEKKMYKILKKADIRNKKNKRFNNF